MLRKSQPNFQHFVKETEAQTKNGFSIKKRLFFVVQLPSFIHMLFIRTLGAF